MKKLISMLLCIAVLPLTPVFAERNTEQMQEILSAVRERVGDTEAYSDFSSDSFGGEYGTEYTFSWRTDGEDGYERMNVTCNADGIITYYSVYSDKEGEDERYSINRTPRAEAMKKAQEAVDRLNPSAKGEFRVSDPELYESFRNDAYYFNVQRYKNGIPVRGDNGMVRLDTDCELKNFRISYTTGPEFEDIQGAITEDAAAIAYNGKIGAKLRYTNLYEEGKNKVILVYDPSDGKYINALTEEAVEITGYHYSGVSKEEATDSSGGGGSRNYGFSAAEIANLEAVEGLMSETEIDALVKGCGYFNIGNDAELSYYSLYRGGENEDYRYGLTYNVDGEEAYITADAKTGEIVSFYRWGKEKPQDAPPREEIKKRADEILTTLAGAKAAEFKADDETENEEYVSYRRYANGIMYDSNTVSMSFDGDMNLRSYHILYNDVEFPKPDGVLTKEEAFAKIRENTAYELCYMADYALDKFVPVYALSGEILIDAFTGEPTAAYRGEEKGGEYTDISGHYAEEQIKTLAKFGIFFSGDEFKPDAEITRGEYAALLEIVFSYDNTSLLRDGVTERIKSAVKKFSRNETADPEGHLTRIEAAKQMVRAMGAEAYAELSGIYARLYDDVGEDVGYVNLLTGMGVVSGNGTGGFNPNTEITRAQAAVMIYNYLAR